MDHLEESWYHITSEIGILLVVLLVLALLISIVQLRTINKLKKNKAEVNSSSENDISNQKEDSPEQANENVSTEENEDLKNQLKSKTIELAKVAKENDQKNQLLSDLKEKLAYLQEHPSAIDRITKDAIRLIESVSIKGEDTFDFQIDELNQVLYNRLREKFPELTTNDLRLCAYIKIGLDSKEIANIFSIKPSSIYINRSRLRKKLNLEPEIDLYAFLNSDF